MSPEDRDTLRAHLEQQLADLKAAKQSGMEAESTVELDQTRTGRLTRMDALQQQAMAKETGRRRRSQLAAVRYALDHLADPDFGFCTECDEPINPRRLAVDPSTRLCIQCASARE